MVMRKPSLQQKRKTMVLSFPLDLRLKMYEVIGEYVARVSRFDFHLIEGISLLAGIQNKKKRRIAFMGMTFNARLGTLKALATYWAPNKRLRDQIYGIVRAGQRIRKTRNSFAHGVWGHAKGEDRRRLRVYHAPESKDYYLPSAPHYTADEVRAKARSVRSLDARLEKVLKQLRVAKIP